MASSQSHNCHSLMDEKDLPWCLCDRRWYRALFRNNPLHINKYYWFGWVDPESWLEWWHLGVPVRWYYWKRDKWIDMPFTQQRGIKIWKNATPIELEPPKRTPDADDDGTSKRDS